MNTTPATTTTATAEALAEAAHAACVVARRSLDRLKPAHMAHEAERAMLAAFAAIADERDAALAEARRLTGLLDEALDAEEAARERAAAARESESRAFSALDLAERERDFYKSAFDDALSDAEALRADLAAARSERDDAESGSGEEVAHLRAALDFARGDTHAMHSAAYASLRDDFTAARSEVETLRARLAALDARGGA